MCEGKLAGHPELWRGTSTLPESRGPEEDLKLWAEAEGVLDALSGMAESLPWNEAVLVALTDAYNRCIEERRRAEDLLKLHENWSKRRIGGVVETDGG